jgi:choline dehydrogenase
MYDFIVVGCGSSGCALVHELHQLHPDKTILILEAGGDNKDERISNFKRAMETYNEFTWPLYSIPQKEFNERKMPYISGKGNGGSGAINGMVCVQPHPKDKIMKYLKEESINKYKEFFHPTTCFTKNEMSEVAMNCLLEKGFMFTENYLDKDEASEKIAYPRLNVTENGLRLDPYSIFVKDLDCEKVQIINNAKVDTLLFDEQDTVCGVVVEINNQKQELYANHEVILAAGAIYTPEILLKSGIGPVKTLLKNNIRVIKDLPVGEHLHDQIMVYATCPIEHNVKPYIMNTMTLTSFFAEDNFVFEPEFRFIAVDNTRQPKFQLQTYLIKDQPEEMGENALARGQDSLFVCIILLHPESRGQVSLKDGELIVDPRCSSADADFPDLIKAMKIAMQITDQLPESHYGKRNFPPVDYQDNELIRYIKQIATTNHHPGGTCKLGSVTDYQNRVIGVNGLRVVDSSIIPEPVSGNPQLTAFAIGFQAAQNISADYQAVLNITDYQGNNISL